MKKQWFKVVFAICGVLMLILDSKTALGGASDGVVLCIQVVIPSLFPYFVLMNILNSNLMTWKLQWLSCVEKLLRLPQNTASIWLCGILGGYPTGAQLVHSAWKQGSLSKPTAERLLLFCSNAGPAFLFGIIASQFDNGAVVWSIWAIHIISSILVAMIVPSSAQVTAKQEKTTSLTFSDALKKSVATMGQVCGWIVLFRILIAFSRKWFLWLLPNDISTLLICLLELANGSSILRNISHEGMRMLIATVAVNFGGICVLMQTASVTSGLPLSNYLKGKLLQTLFGLVLTLPVQRMLFTPVFDVTFSLLYIAAFAAIPFILIYLSRNRKITVAFQEKTMYNLLTEKRKG